MRSHSAGTPIAALPMLHLPRSSPSARRSKAEAGQRARSVDGQAPLERQLIAAQPPADHDAHVQLRARSEAVVAAHVEETARVLVLRAGRERRPDPNPVRCQ